MAISDHSPPRAVLLDFDHTLFTFDDGVDWVRAANARLGRFVHETRVRSVHAAIEEARRLPEVVAGKVGCERSPDLHRKAILAWFGAAGVDDALAAALYERLTSPAGWTPYTDVREHLHALRERGVPVAVVSNVGWDIRPTFAAHGLRDLVDTFVLSCEQGVQKPELAMFQIACRNLGVPPHEALMVGDDPVNDGASASVGLRFHLLPDRAPGGCRGLSAALAHLDRQACSTHRQPVT